MHGREVLRSQLLGLRACTASRRRRRGERGRARGAGPAALHAVRLLTGRLPDGLHLLRHRCLLLLACGVPGDVSQHPCMHWRAWGLPTEHYHDCSCRLCSCRHGHARPLAEPGWGMPRPRVRHRMRAGTMGLVGDLTAGEILEQLVHAQAISRIKNVVFMVGGRDRRRPSLPAGCSPPHARGGCAHAWCPAQALAC